MRSLISCRLLTEEISTPATISIIVIIIITVRTSIYVRTKRIQIYSQLKNKRASSANIYGQLEQLVKITIASELLLGH